MNTPFYNLSLGMIMLLARFIPIVALLSLAGSMAVKRVAPVSQGSFPTDGPLFIGLLIGVVVIVGALTFLPALFLGPIAEHFLMLQGKVF